MGDGDGDVTEWPTWSEALDQMHKVLDDTVELAGRTPGFRYCPGPPPPTYGPPAPGDIVVFDFGHRD